MKKIKTSFSIDPNLLRELTDEAREFGCSRSQLVSRILCSRKYLTLLEDIYKNARFLRGSGEPIEITLKGSRIEDYIQWDIIQKNNTD